MEKYNLEITYLDKKYNEELHFGHHLNITLEEVKMYMNSIYVPSLYDHNYIDRFIFTVYKWKEEA